MRSLRREVHLNATHLRSLSQLSITAPRCTTALNERTRASLLTSKRGTLTHTRWHTPTTTISLSLLSLTHTHTHSHTHEVAALSNHHHFCREALRPPILMIHARLFKCKSHQKRHRRPSSPPPRGCLPVPPPAAATRNPSSSSDFGTCLAAIAASRGARLRRILPQLVALPRLDTWHHLAAWPQLAAW